VNFYYQKSFSSENTTVFVIDHTTSRHSIPDKWRKNYLPS